MKIFDIHTDILFDVYHAAIKGDKERFKNYHVKQLSNSKITSGVWTLYSPDEFDLLEAYKTSLNNIDFTLLDNFYVILGLESLRNLKSLEEFQSLHDLGVRHAMLTWNEENVYATGVSGDKKRGVTKEGYKVLDFMIDRDMIIDVSHLNEKSFYDVLNYTNKNIIASHSNIKSIRDHRRNLSDDQLKKLKEVDGLLGLTLAGAFIAEDKEERTIDKYIEHIDYAVKIMGINNVSLGFDFMDYFENYQGANINEIPNATKVYKLIDKLLKLGYSNEDIEKIAYKNFYNRFKHHILK